ncbi:MAG TPA: glycoside hydrolase family 3 protein [Candidatus Saccharimonadales bacterium]|nr:glycoside hydrolase family 3 protein [Candidatus Saccharimonadales bacterium]
MISSENRSRVDERVDALLAAMTITEKIGQLTQVEVNSIAPAEVRDEAIGSVLSGGGGNPSPNTPASWAARVRRYQEAALQSRLGIPILYGVDAVHGHNNAVGATIFPHNIGLGATRDPDLVSRVARATACELLATNVPWTFAPNVSVPQDIRWGRTYEGFGERTELVSELAGAYVRGLAAGSDHLASGSRPTLASLKHFVGDGGTTWGTSSRYPWIPGWWQSPVADRWQIDQGDLQIDEVALRRIHLPPYLDGIAAGARTVMASYSSWNGVKVHGHRGLLTDLLKGELGFDGFVVSDWLAVRQISEDFDEGVASALNAGLDMVMVPYEYRRFVDSVHHALETNRISLERINDACRRILRVKVEIGLFERPFGDEHLLTEVGGVGHRALAREAVRKSVVLLKNDGESLPASPDAGLIIVAGAPADDIGTQCGGWTIEWQGRPGPVTAGTSLLEAINGAVSAGTRVLYEAAGRFPDVLRASLGIVVLAEPPYAEGEGDRLSLSLPRPDVELVERMRARCDRLVVVLFSGRPLLINEVIDLADSFVAAWLPGTEATGIADVLFGDYPFVGQLPVTWPATIDQVPLGSGPAHPRFDYGFGLTTEVAAP